MCKHTKAVRVINRKAPERTKIALQWIHNNIWGPFSVATPYGDTYFATFTNDFMQKSWVYLMKKRSQLHSIFIQFQYKGYKPSYLMQPRHSSLRQLVGSPPTSPPFPDP
jgi:hypothetical protein